MATIARGLGRPLQPWQRFVSDVAGEVDGDGRLTYQTVVLSVPRRAGKSILTLATGLQRVGMVRLGRGWYTAQTGMDASSTFLQSWAPLIDDGPLARLYSVRKQTGSQWIGQRRGGSTFGVFAPTETAMHGKDADVGVIDEAWAFDIVTGNAVIAGLGPAMATRANPQTWIVSAGGTEASAWWDQVLARAEDWCDAGGLEGVALFDWGAGDDDDRADPAVWRRAHPAVGHTIDERFIAGELRDRDAAYFDRMYLNRWPRLSTRTTGRLIDLERWSSLAGVGADLEPPVTLAYDVAPDRTWASIAGACTLDGGATLVTILDAGAGVGWLPGRLEALGAGWIVADSLGGAVTANALERRGVLVDLIGPTELVQACGTLIDAVRDGTVAHHAQAALDEAVAGAATRQLADGVTWSRSRSPVDITGLMAAALAVWGHTVRVPYAGAIS